MPNPNLMSCGDAQEALERIKGSEESLLAALAKAALSGDLSWTDLIRQEMSMQLDRLKDGIDVHEVRFRDQLARDGKYKYVGVFSEKGVAVAQTETSKVILIDRDGEQIPSPYFDSGTLGYKPKFQDGWLPVMLTQAREKSVHAFLDEEMEIMANTDGKYQKFDYAGAFHEGFAIVQPRDDNPSKGRQYIDTQGNIIGDPELFFTEANNFSEGFAAVRDGMQCKYINWRGEIVAKGYQRAESFHEGFAGVRMLMDGRLGWIFLDTEFKPAFNEKFDSVGAFSNGLANVKKDGKWNYLKVDGTYLLDEWVDEVLPVFSEGFGFVKTGTDGWFINTAGEKVIHVKSISGDLRFTEGAAWYKNEQEQAVLINTKGVEICRIPYGAFDLPGWFMDGVARSDVVPDGSIRQCYLDKRGKEVFYHGEE